MATKLLSAILDSSVWDYPDHIRIVWVTMLAMANRHGKVEAAITGVAHRSRVTLPQAQEAVALLSEPDPHSRTQDNEGRRIAKCDGGWLILNYVKHQRTTKAERREQAADASERYRQRASSSVIDRHQPSSNAVLSSDNTEELRVDQVKEIQGVSDFGSKATSKAKTEEESEAKPLRGSARRGTRLDEGWTPQPEAVAFAEDLGLDAGATADEFRDYWIAAAGARAVKANWNATWRNWCRRAAEKRGWQPGSRRRLSPAEERTADAIRRFAGEGGQR